MVSQKVLKSLKYYQGTGYGKINELLRGENLNDSFMGRYSRDELVQHVKNIDSAMRNNGKLSGHTLYRGIAGQLIPKSQENSGVIVSTGYSSCTTDFSIAKSSFTDARKCCVLVFKIPPNIDYYGYTYEKTKAKALREHEVLLQRNIQFVDITETGTRNVYTCVLKKYTHPTITNKEEKQIQEMRDQFSKRQKTKTLEELIAEYMAEGEDEESATFLAEDDLGL